MAGENKGDIGYKAFLTSRQLRAYLELMLKHELKLVDENTRKYKYKTTTNGIRFAEFDSQFSKIFDAIDGY